MTIELHSKKDVHVRLVELLGGINGVSQKKD